MIHPCWTVTTMPWCPAHTQAHAPATLQPTHTFRPTASMLQSHCTIMHPPSHLSINAHAPWHTHTHTSTTHNPQPCYTTATVYTLPPLLSTCLSLDAHMPWCTHTHTSIGIDGDRPGKILLFKQVGKVVGLHKHLMESNVDKSKSFLSQVSIAHTHWATHGLPAFHNCHPIHSDPTNEFTIIHNSIVTNSGELRLILQRHGYKFKSETDSEAMAVLTKFIYDSQPNKCITFPALIRPVLLELEGSFMFIFKSRCFPNEVVTTQHRSPLLIGAKTEKKLKVEFVDVEFVGQDEVSAGGDSGEQ